MVVDDEDSIDEEGRKEGSMYSGHTVGTGVCAKPRLVSSVTPVSRKPCRDGCRTPIPVLIPIPKRLAYAHGYRTPPEREIISAPQHHGSLAWNRSVELASCVSSSYHS